MLLIYLSLHIPHEHTTVARKGLNKNLWWHHFMTIRSAWSQHDHNTKSMCKRKQSTVPITVRKAGLAHAPKKLPVSAMATGIDAMLTSASQLPYNGPFAATTWEVRVSSFLHLRDIYLKVGNYWIPSCTEICLWTTTYFLKTICRINFREYGLGFPILILHLVVISCSTLIVPHVWIMIQVTTFPIFWRNYIMFEGGRRILTPHAWVCFANNHVILPWTKPLGALPERPFSLLGRIHFQAQDEKISLCHFDQLQRKQIAIFDNPIQTTHMFLFPLAWF